jgi:hypothetical protein
MANKSKHLLDAEASRGKPYPDWIALCGLPCPQSTPDGKPIPRAKRNSVSRTERATCVYCLRLFRAQAEANFKAEVKKLTDRIDLLHQRDYDDARQRRQT